MASLTSPPLWQLLVNSAGADLARSAGLTLTVTDHTLVATATSRRSRPVAAAWAATAALAPLWTVDYFAPIGLEVRVGSLRVSVPADVMVGVADGQSREW